LKFFAVNNQHVVNGRLLFDKKIFNQLKS